MGPEGPQGSGLNFGFSGGFNPMRLKQHRREEKKRLKTNLNSNFLILTVWTQRTLNLGVNIEFLIPNCVYRQLERSEFCELSDLWRKLMFEHVYVSIASWGYLFLDCSRNRTLYFWGFPVVWSRKFGFRKVREVCRIHFHLVAPLKSSVVTSYDQNTQKVND